MPEIAEVRVVASTLKRQLLNRKIINTKVLYKPMIETDVKEFNKLVTNRTIKDIKTYGKWIIFDLGDYSLLSHLRMEGKYFYVNRGTPINKHIHVIFELDNNMDLRYQDVRKFGKMQLVKTDEIFDTECIKKLGIEPDNKDLTPEYLLNKFKNKNKTIKELLLDQTIINGLGNIYANEVLFASNINPYKKAKDITKKESEDIINSSKEIITNSYKMGGCTIRSYTSSLGVIGHYQDELKVQSREGLPCKKCGSRITRVTIAGRSTFYCKTCQK